MAHQRVAVPGRGLYPNSSTQEIAGVNVGRNRATAALTYTCRGWPIIPVVPKAKVPLIAHGLKDATTDPERIRDWWRRSQNANIGLVTGERSGFFVLDVDGVEGEKSQKERVDVQSNNLNPKVSTPS